MSFRFQNHVLYELLRQFAKDIFIFTGKLPNYERNGLIIQIRNLSTSLVQDFAEGFARTAKGDSPTEAVDKCITTIVRITSLIDLCHHLEYTDSQTHTHWISACDDLVKRLYDSRKTL